MTDSLPRLRERLEDFQVEELPLYEPSGDGGHTFVHLEKRLRTTEDVARDLARAAACRARDVGYAGRKDRRAITRQWYSVPGLDPEVARALEIPGVSILGAARHPHKLRTGQLRGNRFTVVVRGVGALDLDAVRARLEHLRCVGLPNRFGRQRFGRNSDNADTARALLRGEAVAGDRRSLRFLLSALQAEVFNEVLARRPLGLEFVEAGDVAVVHRSGGLFLVEDEARENERAESFEISATGPIFGTKAKTPIGAVAEREAAVLEELGISPAADLRLPTGIRLRGTRRPLRIPLLEFAWSLEADALRLDFALPAGSYATVLVEAAVGAVRESA